MQARKGVPAMGREPPGSEARLEELFALLVSVILLAQHAISVAP